MEDIRFFILIIIDVYWGRKNIARNKEKKYFEGIATKFLELCGHRYFVGASGNFGPVFLSNLFLLVEEEVYTYLQMLERGS